MTWLLLNRWLVHGNEIAISTWNYAVYSQSILIDTVQLYSRSFAWCISCMLQVILHVTHDDGKCTNCMLQLLHRIDIDCFRFEFLFLLVSSSLPIWVFIRVHISLDFVVLIICRPLQILPAFSSWTLTHTPVDMIKTCSFYNCQTCKQILIIVLNKIQSF